MPHTTGTSTPTATNGAIPPGGVVRAVGSAVGAPLRVAPAILGEAAARGAGPATGPDAWGVRMRDFLTDGSVAGLCDQLTKLTGVPIWLRDQGGEAIIPKQPTLTPAGVGGDDAAPWSIVPDAEGQRRAIELSGGAGREFHEPFYAVLKISRGVLGSIAACMPKVPSGADAEAEAERLVTVRRAVTLLASSVCDVCEAQAALRGRVLQLDALYRLSALLSGRDDVDAFLEDALGLAIEVLGVDAGVVSTMEETDGDPALIPAAWRGLSASWAQNPTPLSEGAVFRQSALLGHIVHIPDLQADERVADKPRVQAEGLRGMLMAAMFDRGKPVGLVRLFTRSRREFTGGEGELLRAIAEHMATAVAGARLRALRQRDEAMSRQVRMAASVQRRMLPRRSPKVPPFDVAAHYAPSLELGGDFYDFLELGGHLGVLIGDVVGKGLPAALLMSAVRASLRAHAQDVYDIDEVLSRVNRALARDTLDNEFATVWYGVADPATLRLTYCGAGHDWPVLVRVPKDRPVGETDVQRLTADGMALGIDAAQRYPKGVFQLQARDVLVAYTDGLHDAQDFEGRKFGGKRLKKALLELLAAEPEASASRVLDAVLAAVRRHAGLAGSKDDITVVVLRVSGN